MKIKDKPYPNWICWECGKTHGNKIPMVACYHVGNCDICRKRGAVTEPRDFGHLKDTWKQHKGLKP